MSLLNTKSLSIGYGKGPESKILQKDINLAINEGEIISLMGQNGVGKTTFIKTLAGLLDPISGSVQYGEQDLSGISSGDLAQKMSLVLTEKPFNFNITPIELISISRHPYSNWIGVLSPRDKEVIEWALNETHLNYIANRKLYELSDGQLQKVMIARALAQETALIILDEPASHLDLNNKIEVMMLLKKIASQGKGILISTHDLQVSTQLSDRLLLFNFNEDTNEGVPEDLILDGTLQKSLYLDQYGYDMISGTINFDQKGPSVSVSGDPETKFWVTMALKRKGYIVKDEKQKVEIICSAKNHFKILQDKKKLEVKSIETLLKNLSSI
tara:strand:+ start:232 stop:1215 length:984 start_codon:yes stop_codon:yes gene_type:complete